MADVKMSELAADSSIGGAEKLLALDGSTSKTVTTLQLAEYALANIPAKGFDDPVGGDYVVATRSTDIIRVPVESLASYVVASGWTNAASGAPAATGDKILAQREGTVVQLDVEDVKTYVLSGTQGEVLDLTGLDDAELSGASLLLIGASAVPKKTTLADLETKLWTDFASYLTGLTAVANAGAVDDADLLYVTQGGTPKKLTATILAGYVANEAGSAIVATLWAAAAVTPAAAGDVFVVQRTGTQKTLTTDDIFSYVNTTLAATGAPGSAVTGDKVLSYRGATRYLTTVDMLASFALGTTWGSATETATSILTTDYLHFGTGGASRKITVANFAAGVRSTILDVSGLSLAAIGTGDLLTFCQTGVAKQAPLSALETRLWSDFSTYVGTLSAVSEFAGSEVLYTIQGTPKKFTVSSLLTYVTTQATAGVLAGIWDWGAVASVTDGDKIPVRRNTTNGVTTVDAVKDYTLTALAGSASLGSLSAGDDFLVYHSGVPKMLDMAVVMAKVLPYNWALPGIALELMSDADVLPVGHLGETALVSYLTLQEQLLTAAQPSVLSFGTLTGVSYGDLNLTDKFILNQGEDIRTTTLADLEQVVCDSLADYVPGLTELTPVTDVTKFYAVESGGKWTSALTIYSYALSKFWATATTSSAATGDLVPIYRAAGGVGTRLLTVDNLASFVKTSVQAQLFVLTGLTEANPLSSSDLFLVCQSGNARKVELGDVAAEVLGGLSSYVDGLSQHSAPADADELYCLTGGMERKLTLSKVKEYIGEPDRWKVIDADSYTATPLSENTLTMGDTTGVKVGCAVRYKFNSNTYYGMVAAVVTDIAITIYGPPLDTDYNVTELSIGGPELVQQLDLHIEPVWDGSVQEVYANVGKKVLCWRRGAAHIVFFSAVQGTVDTGNQPYLNINTPLGAVGTDNAALGLQCDDTPWVWASNGGIDPDNYSVSLDDPIEISCTQAGENGDAADLTVSILFVLE